MKMASNHDVVLEWVLILIVMEDTHEGLNKILFVSC